MKSRLDELVSPQIHVDMDRHDSAGTDSKMATCIFNLNVSKSLNIQTVCGEKIDKSRVNI